MNLENDELRERLRFMDQRYSQALQRFGASPEDMQELEEQVQHRQQQKAQGAARRSAYGEDEEA